MRPILTIDLETTGLNWRQDRIHGIGYRMWTGEMRYVTAEEAPAYDEMIAALADPGIDKLGQNVIFDVRFLRAKGYKVDGRLLDTKIMAHLVDENGPLGLKELTPRYLGEERLAGKSELDRVIRETGTGHVGNLAARDILDPRHPYSQLIGTYCLEDVQNTWDLYQVLRERLLFIAMRQKEQGYAKTVVDYYLEVAQPFESAQVELELHGIRVNPEAITERKKALEEHIAYTDALLRYTFAAGIQQTVSHFKRRVAEKKAQEVKTEKRRQELLTDPEKEVKLEFSWTKTAHLGYLLFDVLRVPKEGIRRTATGKESLDKEAMRVVRMSLPKDHPVMALLDGIDEIHASQKLLSTYVGEEGGTGLRSYVEEHDNKKIVFPEYSTFLLTDRLSCSSPNVQNIPRGEGIKRFFIPHEPENCVLHFDASQVELRIAAHLTQDPEMVRAFTEGVDLHRQTAGAMFRVDSSTIGKEDPRRQAGKHTNFLLIYDGGPTKLQSHLKAKADLDFTIDECREFIRGFFDKYKVTRHYLDTMRQRITRQLYVVAETGRVRRLPEARIGRYLDYRRRTFDAPMELTKPLCEELERRQKLPDAVKAAPPEQKLFVLASLKYSHALKQGINFPNQHLGSVITKLGVVALSQLGYKVMSTVHDSIDIEVPRRTSKTNAETIKKVLEEVYRLRVPLVWDYKILNSFDEADTVKEE